MKKQKPKCNVCGKIIAGIRNLNETNYCSSACEKSAELFELRKSREDHDIIQERRKITEKKQDNIVKKRRRVKCVECGFI